MSSAPSGPSSLVPSGPFSLREAALFGFGQRRLDHFDGVLRLAMCLDGSYQPVAVAVRQQADGTVRIETAGLDTSGPEPPGLESPLPDPTAVGRQVARVLSLDHDGAAFVRLAERDPVLARLLAVAPGLRPPRFHNAYEAAVWAVLSARAPERQTAALRRQLSERHGTAVRVAGQVLHVLPAPDRLLEVAGQPGLSAEKLTRLHGVARAALSGVLDTERLRALDPGQASAELQTLRGIGPFSAQLIVVRALGHADVLPTGEQIGLTLVGELYGLGGPASQEQLETIGELWRPFRTWALVLVRAAAARLPSAASR